MLHLSMNTPVVAIEDFPVGPARAGVSLSEGDGGDLRLEIAVRAVRTGQLLFYASDDAFSLDSDASHAVEAALSFAEGMGFLFDEDEVVARGAEGSAEAADLWQELIADSPEATAGAAEPEPVLELVREVPVRQHEKTVHPIAVTSDRNEAVANAPALGGREASLACRVLSKFRLSLVPGRTARGLRRGEPNEDGAVVSQSVVDAELRIRLLSGF